MNDIPKEVIEKALENIKKGYVKEREEEFKELVRFHRKKMKKIHELFKEDILKFCFKYGYKGKIPEVRRAYYIHKPREFEIWLKGGLDNEED